MSRPTHITGVIGALILMLCIHASFAGSAIWGLNPGSGDWNTAADWTPTTVPNGPADTAFFDLSNTTGLSISANTEVNGIVFDSNAGLNPFTITASPGFTLTLSGAGITNNSGRAQAFVTAVDAANNGLILFGNNATAGSGTFFTNSGGTVINHGGGSILFQDSSSAGSAAITNSRGTILFSFGSSTVFVGASSAGSATINNNGADGFSGFTEFLNNSTAGSATITNTRTGIGGGGFTEFFDNSTAGSATITNNIQSGTFFFDNSSAGSAIITNNGSDFFDGLHFRDSSTAGSATITNNAGSETLFFGTSTASSATITNNAGGVTQFDRSSTAGNATIINNGASISGASGGETIFSTISNAFNPLGPCTAGDATLIANGGTGGGLGGAILFEKGNSRGGTSRVEVFGNGNLDISRHNAPGVTVGSVEGSGDVFLGANNLTVSNKT